MGLLPLRSSETSSVDHEQMGKDYKCYKQGQYLGIVLIFTVL